MWCEFSGKKSYDTKSKARAARKHIKNTPYVLEVYRCEHCDKFHLGRNKASRSPIPAKRHVKL